MNEEKVICESCGAEMNDVAQEHGKMMEGVFICPNCGQSQDECDIKNECIIDTGISLNRPVLA